jgi:hypothetical protein
MTLFTLFEQVGWQPTIGDPTFMGWFTVAAYFLTAAAALKLSFAADAIFPRASSVKQQRFWLILGALLFFLGINKQLDLQSLLTAVGRYYARQDGWYDQRRTVQVAVIGGILITMCTAMLLFVLHFRTIFKANMLAIVGLGFLLLFIAVRATSFHHMDMLINFRILNVRMNWVLELTGICAIGIPALGYLRLQK